MSSTTEGIAELARRILEPLCEETAKLLKPVRLQPNDRLDVKLNEDATAFIIQPYARVRDQAVNASHAARHMFPTRVPERKDLSNNRWELAATDVTALILAANWTDDCIDWEPEAKALYDFLLTRFMSQTLQSQHRANYKLCGVMPPLPDDWHDHAEKPLSPYQVVECVGMLGQECAALFAEQGTGKTPPSIRRVCIEARRFAKTQERKPKKRLYTVLIACPKNVRNNWQNEFHEFATTPGKVTVLRGGQLERMKLILETLQVDAHDDSEYAVIVCSYETIRMSWDIIRMIPWNLVIADESHMMKESRTARWKTMVQLRNISEARLVLTGTPVCNNVVDLFAQLEFLGEGMSGFTTRKAYRDFYAVLADSQHEQIVSYQNLPLLQERLARIAFMITKKEAMPYLPEKLYDVRDIEMSSIQREHYIKLQEQLALEIDEDKTLTANHILVKLLRLTQITSGFLCWDAKMDPETGDVVHAKQIEYLDPNPKLEAFVEYVKESGPEEKIIVWACFKPDMRQIAARLAADGIPFVEFHGGTSDVDRAEAERRFNKEHARVCKVFIGNPAAGGTGLNLRGYDPDSEGTPNDHGCNCTRVAYYSQGWSMVHRNQSEDRAHRRGTRVPVQYTDFVVPNTVDEMIRERVMKKTLNALTIQDIREIMERVLSTRPEEAE